MAAADRLGLRLTTTSIDRTPAARSPASTGPSPARPSTTTTVAPASVIQRSAPAPSGTRGPGGRAGVDSAATATTAPAASPAGHAHRRAGSPNARARAAAATTAASAPTCTPSSRPKGRAANDWLTARTHHSSARVGTWISRATPPPSTPATSPPDMPQTMSGSAAGTASRFAGSAASGTPSGVVTRSGATKVWAAMVTDNSSATGRGPGRRACNAGPRTMMPAEAATDRRKPSEATRNGSTSTRAATARARARTGATGRPRVVPSVAMSAIAVARSTDGSNRVRRANIDRLATTRANRVRMPVRVSSGRSNTNTNATFSPETASK
jgi:hypothetical protein